MQEQKLEGSVYGTHDLAMDSYHDTGILFVCISADSTA